MHIKIGDVFIENTFLSTCKSLKMASCFSSDIFEIHWKQTMPFLYLIAEDELLTLPMIQLKCIDILNTKDGNKWILEACSVFSQEKLDIILDSDIDKDINANILNNDESYYNFLRTKINLPSWDDNNV
jgi:hypothetical protein